jgi:hypothetical protein
MVKLFSERTRIAKIDAGIARLKQEIEELQLRTEREAQSFLERGMYGPERALKKYADQGISWREKYIRHLEMEKPPYLVYRGDGIYERRPVDSRNA